MSNFPDILRAVQKDELVVNQVTHEFSTEFMLNLLGPKLWLQNTKWIEAACQFLYNAVTTLSDYQTVGEEYTGILQVTKQDGRPALPSLIRRLLMVFMQSFSPAIIDKWLIPKMQGDRRAVAEEVVKLIHKLNLMWFYYNGIFYHISKRLCQIEYAKLRPMSYQPPNLKWIKVLSIINGLILMYNFCQKLKKLHREESKISANVNHSKKKCPLCLEARTNATSTICGHVFCWNCIVGCIQSKPECPICRETLSSAKIIPLANYV